MRRFDVLAAQYPIDALYSADNTRVSGTVQVYDNLLTPVVKALVFNSTLAAGSRPLVIDGGSSIQIGPNSASNNYFYNMVTVTNTFGFSCVMDVIVPGNWLVYFTLGTNNIGVYWNRKDQFTFHNVEAGVATTYVETVDLGTKYVSYQYNGTSSIITVNNKVFTFPTDNTTIATIFGGQGTDGILLADKIAITSSSTSVLPLSLYSTLFKYNSLTNIYRPGDKSHFVYLNDSARIKRIILDNNSFKPVDATYTKLATYPYIDSAKTYAIYSNAQFAANISSADTVGGTVTNIAYPAQEYLRWKNTAPIVINHTDTSDKAYNYTIVESSAPLPGLVGSDVTISGSVFASHDSPRGYYLEQGFDTSTATINIAAKTGVTIGSIELMGQSSSLTTADITVNGAAPVGTLYTNGVVGNPRANQYNHCVFVFATAVSHVEITNAPRLAGFGISDIAYAAADVKKIFDTYAGNTYQPPAEIMAKPLDGVLANGPITALSIKWPS
jgi:hypothetical protein